MRGRGGEHRPGPGRLPSAPVGRGTVGAAFGRNPAVVIPLAFEVGVLSFMSVMLEATDEVQAVKKPEPPKDNGITIKIPAGTNVKFEK